MIRCAYCGYDVPRSDRFCGRCGKELSFSQPIITHTSNSLPLHTTPSTWAGRVSRSIIRLSHINQRPHGLRTIIRTLREAVEEREKAQQRTLVVTYLLVAVLLTLTLSVLYFELHAHGIMH